MAKQPDAPMTTKEAREQAKREPVRLGDEEGPKIDEVMPAEGGSYVRNEDGSLRRAHAPTVVPDVAPKTPTEEEARRRARAVAEASAPKSK